MISQKSSFKGWNYVEFLKGHKKVVYSMVGYLIGLVTTNSEVVATGSAFAFASVLSIAEYYFKKININ